MQDLLHGKEIFNFFTIYHVNGIIAIAIFCILMFFVLLKILNLKLEYNLTSYHDFLKLLESQYSFFHSKIFLLVINLFLAITFYIMLIGLCTLFSYQFGFQKILITFIMVCLCYYLLHKNNLNFLYVINSILMPVLILFILFLSLDNINFSNVELIDSPFFSSIFEGLLYFSYNSLLIIPILFKLKHTNRKGNLCLSLLFSIIIFILTLLTNLLLLSHFNDIKNIDLPILFICNTKGNLFSFLYFFILLSAILSTLFSSGYSFMMNIQTKNRKNILKLFLSLSFIFTAFSFSNLINFFYPIFGLLGFVQLWMILYGTFKKKK